MSVGYGNRLGPHRPIRPGWLCCWCCQPYPCVAGQRWLIRKLGYGSPLAELAADLMADAIADGVSTDPGALFERFIAWTRAPWSAGAGVQGR